MMKAKLLIILRMQQWGRRALQSSQIDDLVYDYIPGSNRLKQVVDNANDPNSKLGDFKYTTKGSQDYFYDGNGNMTSDANKNISSIQYNYLNLPSVITVTGKGTISYVYDAAGNKIQKTVAESAQPVKTTLYLGGAVYENDVMQFLGHEEGRIRFSPAGALFYDYMLKDHLGNVRMVLTEEVQTKSFPVASMEPAQEANESQYYTNINSTIRSTKPANYPADGYTSPNAYAAKLNGQSPATKIGPAIILKVMAGDRFNLRVNSWWSYGGGGTLTTPSPLTELASALASGIAGASGGKVTALDLTNSGLTATAATSFLGSQNTAASPTKPMAFVNWVLLDENFNIARDSAGNFIRDGYSNFEQVHAADNYDPHVWTNQPINKNGYLYIYVSNQSPNMNVYFDNLQVTHIKGPILEETHYSPWGLSLAAISSKAITNAAENKFKYNGKEEQKREFADGSGLDWLDYGARMYDNQVARWLSVDGHSESYYSSSPFNYAAQNPIIFVDPNGMDAVLFDEKGRKVATFSGSKIKIEKGMENSEVLKSFQRAIKYVEKYSQTFNNIFSSKSTVEFRIGDNDITIVNLKKENLDIVDGKTVAKVVTVKWDPTKALITTDGSVNSPALNLLHEAIHAEHKITDLKQSLQDKNDTNVGHYENCEEMKTIQEVNRVASKIPWEANNRSNHYGTVDKALGVTAPIIMKLTPIAIDKTRSVKAIDMKR